MARAYDETVLGQSSHFVWLNRSKESFTLDVKHAAAKAILDRLLARADVFVQNLVPGAASRLGLSSESLLAKYPRIIVCGISGYGHDGPYSRKKAYDLLIQCEAGVMSVRAGIVRRCSSRAARCAREASSDRKSTRLNSSH